MQELHYKESLKLQLLAQELLREIRHHHHLKSHYLVPQKEGYDHLDKKLLLQLVVHNQVRNQIELLLMEQMVAINQKIFLNLNL